MDGRGLPDDDTLLLQPVQIVVYHISDNGPDSFGVFLSAIQKEKQRFMMFKPLRYRGAFFAVSGLNIWNL